MIKTINYLCEYKKMVNFFQEYLLSNLNKNVIPL